LPSFGCISQHFIYSSGNGCAGSWTCDFLSQDLPLLGAGEEGGDSGVSIPITGGMIQVSSFIMDGSSGKQGTHN